MARLSAGARPVHHAARAHTGARRADSRNTWGGFSMKFTFKRTQIDYCEIEAESEDEAREIIAEGNVIWSDDWVCEIEEVTE